MGTRWRPLFESSPCTSSMFVGYVNPRPCILPLAALPVLVVGDFSVPEYAIRHQPGEEFAGSGDSQ